MMQRPGRRRQRPAPDNTIPSPCNGVCTLDEAQICLGCRRSQDEIRDWMIMDREQKLETLERVAKRHAAGR